MTDDDNEKSDFDDFVKQLQAEIDKKEKEIYTSAVLEEYHNPKNIGVIQEDELSGFGQAQSDSCGDNMLFYLKVVEDHITDIKFRTDGCGVTTAVGSKITTLVKGMRIDEALSLTPGQIEESLDGLPEEHKHCTRLGIAALTNAINDYKKKN